MSVAEMLEGVLILIGLAVVLTFTIRGIVATIDEFHQKKESKSKTELDKTFDSIVRD